MKVVNEKKGTCRRRATKEQHRCLTSHFPRSPSLLHDDKSNFSSLSSLVLEASQLSGSVGLSLHDDESKFSPRLSVSFSASHFVIHFVN